MVDLDGVVHDEVTGTSGSTTLGFLPRRAATLRIAAEVGEGRDAGQVLQQDARETKGISSVRVALGFQFAR